MVDTKVCYDKPLFLLLLGDCEARQHAEEARASKMTAYPRIFQDTSFLSSGKELCTAE